MVSPLIIGYAIEIDVSPFVLVGIISCGSFLFYGMMKETLGKKLEDNISTSSESFSSINSIKKKKINLK